MAQDVHGWSSPAAAGHTKCNGGGTASDVACRAPVDTVWQALRPKTANLPSEHDVRHLAPLLSFSGLLLKKIQHWCPFPCCNGHRMRKAARRVQRSEAHGSGGQCLVDPTRNRHLLSAYPSASPVTSASLHEGHCLPSPPVSAATLPVTRIVPRGTDTSCRRPLRTDAQPDDVTGVPSAFIRSPRPHREP